MKNNFRKSILALALAAFVATPALAAIATSPLMVTANVTASCVVTASPIGFGTQASPTVQNDATGTITATCTTGTPYVIAINSGSGGGETVADRFMQNGTAQMHYNLYLASDHATVWNDTTGKAGTGSGVAQPLTVYGRVSGGQTALPAGSYLDTLTVFVTF